MLIPYLSQFSGLLIQFIVSLLKVFFLSLSVVYRKSRQCFSDFIYILQISSITITMIMCGSMINLRGSFFSFSYKISVILAYVATFAFTELVGIFSLSSSRFFSNCLLQMVFTKWLYIQFVFLAYRNITLTCAIFHKISGFYFSNYNIIIALCLQTSGFVGKEFCLNLFFHFLIWATEYKLWPYLSSLLLWIGGDGLVSCCNIHLYIYIYNIKKYFQALFRNRDIYVLKVVFFYFSRGSLNFLTKTTENSTIGGNV